MISKDDIAKVVKS
jgi:hypothetical protein